MIVYGGQPASFNYVAFDGMSGMFVAGTIYDVTTGSPVLVDALVDMTDLGNGYYVGQFTPLANHSYLVITVVYTDDTYSTPSTNRSPGSDNYDAFATSTALLNFNYAAYDMNPGLDIEATVYNITDDTTTSLEMTYVAFGVYIGQYTGVVGKEYLVQMATGTNLYSPAATSFQCFLIGAQVIQLIELNPATLIGQSSSANLIGQSLNATLVET